MITKAEPQDIPRLIEILKECARGYGSEEDVSLYVGDVERVSGMIATRLVTDFNHHPIYKDVENNIIVGFISWHIETVRNVIGQWYVLPEYQGRGIGSRLMRMALTACLNGKATYIEVVATNKKAIEMYKHYGFTYDSSFDYKLSNGHVIPHIWLKLTP